MNKTIKWGIISSKLKNKFLPRTAHEPITKKIFIILEPITFPNAIFDSFFLKADSVVANSGKDVPKATKVILIIKLLLNPKLSDIPITPLIKNSEPNETNKKPIIMKNKTLLKLFLSLTWFSFSLLLRKY